MRIALVFALASLCCAQTNCNWNFVQHTNNEGWHVYLITNGLIYERDGGQGVDVLRTNDGKLVNWTTFDRFYAAHSNQVNWVQIVLKGKPKFKNPAFLDLTEHN